MSYVKNGVPIACLDRLMQFAARLRSAFKSLDTIRRAAAVHPICGLQIEYSLISRGIENHILTTCRDLGIGITAYDVLSRGLLSGHWHANKAVKGDWRLFSPRFQPGNIERSLEIV
jgi:aryl-alcohol dehydrogenase-like predicted oxidoreductase